MPSREERLLTRVRAQLVDLLTKTGDYEEAYKQISQLAAANPRALDLLMTQGRILLSWRKEILRITNRRSIIGPNSATCFRAW